MRVIVTCGPSYEPIDDVRRLTNFSTGELGLLLTDELTRAGFEVICLKGAGATSNVSAKAHLITLFATNDHLLAKLQRIAASEEIGAVFHAAALADFRVKEVRTSEGDAVSAAKISSRSGGLTISLEPAPKIIRELRPLFPKALIVGWKYEVEGSADDAVAKGARQMEEMRTDLCVLNGRAYGAGFGVLQADGAVTHYPTRLELCVHLAELLKRRIQTGTS